MVLFPPYVVLNHNKLVVRSGYGFLFDLPADIVDFANSRLFGLPANFVKRGRAILIHATVNVATLFIQIFAALVVGGLVYFAFRKE